MLVDARRADLDIEYKAGQELEGADAEYQVALGQAEALEPTPEEAKADAKAAAKSAKGDGA
jgi:hypothetical protein